MRFDRYTFFCPPSYFIYFPFAKLPTRNRIRLWNEDSIRLIPGASQRNLRSKELDKLWMQANGIRGKLDEKIENGRKWWGWVRPRTTCQNCSMTLRTVTIDVIELTRYLLIDWTNNSRFDRYNGKFIFNLKCLNLTRWRENYLKSNL